MLRAGHLNAPLFFAAAIRLDEQLDEDMGIGPAEIFDGAMQRDRLRLSNIANEWCASAELAVSIAAMEMRV
jgi:hypothetical protein